MAKSDPDQPVYQFTVHTPTYNRAHTLQRVYNSLCAQTFRHFEWLIVDDGSTDETCELIEEWVGSASFPVRLIRNQHAGKPAAVMTAVAAARGQWFLILDSDDACVVTALEKFLYYWQRIPEQQRSLFVGVTGLSMDQQGRLVGERYPQDILDSNAIEVKYRYHLKGEKWGFLKTEVLRKQGWPLDKASEFVPEGVWWTQLAKRYKTRYINEMLRIYYHEPGAERLSNQSQPKRYAAGHALWHQTILNDEIQFFYYSPLAFIRSAIHYIRFSRYTGDSVGTQWKGLHKSMARILWLICYPIALLVIILDRI